MGYDSSDDAKWPWLQDIITMKEGKLMIIPPLGHQNIETSTSEAWLAFVFMSQCRNNNELALLRGRFCTMWSFVAEGHRSQIMVLPIQKVSWTLAFMNNWDTFCIGRTMTCDLCFVSAGSNPAMTTSWIWSSQVVPGSVPRLHFQIANCSADHCFHKFVNMIF